MNNYLLRFRPPRIAFSLLLLAAASHWFMAINQPGSLEIFSSPLIGGVTAALGMAVMLWAWRLFKISQVAICPTALTSQLLTGGMYRFSRNPMYLGMILILFGIALTVGTWSFYVVTLLFLGIINFVFCPFEEQKLARAFGDQYRRYCARVRRWL